MAITSCNPSFKFRDTVIYEGSWDNFLDMAQAVIADAEDIPERGEDFAHSVIEKIEAISETVDDRKSVTDGQWRALENMHGGVQKWLN